MNKPVISLVLLATIFGFMISASHVLTRETIAGNRQAFAADQLRTVLDGARDSITQIGPELYYCKDENGLTGFIFQYTTFKAYNGKISFWIAVDKGNAIRGIRVIEHQETPGIGDKIDTSVSNWIRHFDDKNLDDYVWSLRRHGGDFDQFSGATITSKAMVDAVHAGLEVSSLKRNEWLRLLDND
ncbi:MAG: RnfABCDGE type electron transport complex subunit G [Pseudomonadales bacterium]|jgi:RnfABCDGE-type electron transport complex G subunit